MFGYYILLFLESTKTKKQGKTLKLLNLLKAIKHATVIKPLNQNPEKRGKTQICFILSVRSSTAR